MIDQSDIEQFNKIYNITYDYTLRFVICKCSHIEDVQDILQETYLELYKIMGKKKLHEENIQSYILQIARYKVKKHYTLVQRLKNSNRFSKKIEDTNQLEFVEDTLDIEELITNESICQEIWQYVKSKDIEVAKIFFLKFYFELTIKEIASELNVGESYIKNCLYRTLKEVKVYFREDEDT